MFPLVISLDTRIFMLLGFHLRCLIVHQSSSQPLVHQSPSMPMNANLWTWLFYFYVVKWARHEWIAYRITCHRYTMWPHFSYSRMWSHTHGQSIFFSTGEGGGQLESHKHACHQWTWPPPGRDHKHLELSRSLSGDRSAMSPCRVYCLLYTGHTKPLMYELITKDTLLPRRCVAWSCLNRALFWRCGI